MLPSLNKAFTYLLTYLLTSSTYLLTYFKYLLTYLLTIVKVTVDLQGSNFAKIILFAYSKAEKGIYNLVKKLI